MVKLGRRKVDRAHLEHQAAELNQLADQVSFCLLNKTAPNRKALFFVTPLDLNFFDVYRSKLRVRRLEATLSEQGPIRGVY